MKDVRGEHNELINKKPGKMKKKKQQQSDKREIKSSWGLSFRYLKQI